MNKETKTEILHQLKIARFALFEAKEALEHQLPYDGLEMECYNVWKITRDLYEKIENIELE